LLLSTTFGDLDLLSIDLKASFISFACRAFLEDGPFEVGLIRVRYLVSEIRVMSSAAPLSSTGAGGSSENGESDKNILYIR
jgi:hypothetical protein